jgi:site-specific recombinase XerD
MKKDNETIITDFLKWLETFGYSVTFMRHCRLSTKTFLKWLKDKQTGIEQITNQHIVEYQNYLQTRPNKIYKGQTIGVAHLNKTFIVIDKFLEFLRYYGVKNAPVPTNYRIETKKQERPPKVETLLNTSYKAILEEYAVWLDTLGYAESVVIYGKRYTRMFFEWLEKRQIQSINQLTNKIINEYHAYLETRPNWKYKGRMLSVAHLNHNFFAIDKLLEFLHQYGLENTPVPTNRRIEVDNEARILKIETLTQQEIKTLYACIPETYPKQIFAERQEKQAELRVIFALFYGCGLRRSEGWKLRLKDIDFDRKPFL